MGAPRRRLLLALIVSILIALLAGTSGQVQTEATAEECDAVGKESAMAVPEAREHAVIPFECKDISTCLDGFTNPPSYSQCVALGPTREDSIRLDFSKQKSGNNKVRVEIGAMAGAHVFHIAMEDVFMWSRKARQFLNKCRDFMASATARPEGLPSPTQAMSALCEEYKSEAGVNECERISKDKRCIIEESMSLHQSLEIALWSPLSCPRGAEMRRKICECSCWSSIVEIYGPMMQQWASYDDEVSQKLGLLHTMCKRDVVSAFESEFSESSTTQCGLNSIQVTLNPVAPLPAGSVITIIGLNGDPYGDIRLNAISSSFLGDLEWKASTCSQWCSKSGMCPSTGNAEDDSCLARPTPATGKATSSRCVRWCDEDAVLTVKVQSPMPGNTTVVISVTMLNPPFHQTPSPLVVSASGSGFYMKPTEIKPISGSSGVLSARTWPAFTDFTVSEDPCDGAFDSTDQIWRGSCAGMINTLVFSLTPNLELYAGSRITISGLYRSGNASWAPPVFREMSGMLKALSIELWDSATGTLTLRVTEGDGEPNSPVLRTGIQSKFALEFQMPSESDDPAIVKPDITVDVSRAGQKLNCNFETFVMSNVGVLKSKYPDVKSFETRKVGVSTCYPGECNTITITFASNRFFKEDVDDVYIVITGLLGMDNSLVCNPASTCGDPDVNSIPLSDDVEGSNDRNLFQSLSESTGMATWNSAVGSLSMTLARGAEFHPYKNYAVSFKLKNGYVETDLNDIRISAYLKGVCMRSISSDSSAVSPVDSKYSSSLSACTGEQMVQKSAIKVCKPGFSTKKVGQNYPWPGCDGVTNFIAVTLVPNVKIEYPATMHLLQFLGPSDRQVFPTVNVSGVIKRSPNATIVPGVTYAGKNSSNVSFTWQDDGDKVSLPLWAGYPLSPGEEYVFAFKVRNPTQPQGKAPISIRVRGPIFNISDLLDHDLTRLPIAGRTVAGDAAALKVNAPAFVQKVIGQSNPYPDALNTLTVTLVPNIAMGTTRFNHTHVTSKITLSGLVDTETYQSTLAITQSSPSSDLLNKNATWSRADGVLVVSFKNRTKWQTSDVPIIFSFQVKNPGICQTSPQVTVSATSEGTNCPREIAPATMDRDESTVPFADCRACGDGDHCEACVKCDKQCDDKDASPLKVHSPAFIIKKIQQLTTWPGANNKLNITFAANIDFTGSSAIFVSGFVGGTATNGTMSLTKGASLFSTVEWHNGDKVLYLKVASSGVSAGSEQSFEFQLKNPSMAQRAPLITIWALNAGSCLKPVPKCTMDRPTTASLQPLTIDSTKFVAKAIGQSSPFTSSKNTITATLATNFALKRPTKVTLLGLMGSTIASNLALAVTTVAGGNLFETTGVWTHGTGTLVLSLRESADSTPGQNYTISIDLLNPPAAQNAPLVSVAASNVDAVLADSWPNNDLPAGDQVPMKIIQPQIITAKISQSTAFPGARNLITVTLRINAFIQSNSKGAFSITGLMGAQGRTGPVALHSPPSCNGTSCSNVFKSSAVGAPGTAWWQGAAAYEDGANKIAPQSLVLYIADSIQANYDYVFSFDVQNPNCNHNCSEVQIITNGLDFVPSSCSNDINSYVVSPVPRKTPMSQDMSTSTSCAGVVHAPNFDIKTISECSTVNGDPNTVTVTISPNVDLKQGATLSISGLTGTSTDLPTLDLEGPDSTQFSEVTWSRAKGELKMKVRDAKGITMGQVIVFSFSVQNPREGQEPVRPSIGLVSDDVIIGEAVMSGLVLGAGDYPFFKIASISESSTVRRSYNTLMVLMNSNVRIPSGSKVTISGLTGTSFMPVEMERITGMHPYYFSSTFQWTPANGELELSVVSAIPPNSNRMFAFEVKNPSTSQEARTVSISVDCPAGAPGCPAGGFKMLSAETGLAQTKMNGTVLSATTAGEFTVRSIGQLTPYPGELNTLTVTLASSAEFRAAGGDTAIITLSGLRGAQVKPGTTQMKLAGAHPFASGCWNCVCESATTCESPSPLVLEAPVLTLHLAADMVAGRQYIFAFDIINPLEAQVLGLTDLKIGIGYNSGNPVSTPLMKHDLATIPKGVFQAKTGEAAPLTVRSAQFKTKSISQSSPYPCSSNWICATVASSVPLTAEKESTIRFTSFKGATITSGSGEIDLFNETSGLAGSVPNFKSAIKNGNESKGFWNQQPSGAVLTVYASCRIEAGTEITICFEVKNPVEPKSKYSIMVFSSDSNLEQAMDVKASLRLPFGGPDDPHPMYIRTPKFMSLEAVQSSPFPSDDNTITISFQSNVPFLREESCKTTLTIAGLLGSTTVSMRAFTLHNDTSQAFERTGQTPTGSWALESGTLVLNMTTATEAGDKFVVKFTLKNQPTKHDPKDVLVSTSGVVIPPTKATVPNGPPPSKVMLKKCKWLVNPDLIKSCGEGDNAPITIHDPEFIVAGISQESNWPGASNKLTIKIVTNADLRGELNANLSVSTSPDKSSAPAPFLVGDNRDGVFCGVQVSNAERLFVLYSHEHVRSRFGELDDSNAEHFVCVKAKYTYTNRTIAWSWINQTTANLTTHPNAKNRTVHVNSSQFYANHTDWSYYDGSKWVDFVPTPTDLLVARLGNGKVSAISCGGTDPILDESNARCYADRYSSIKAAHGYSTTQLINHWNTVGKGEGKRFNCDCVTDLTEHAICYANRYPTLKTSYGLDAQALINHYVVSGRQQGFNFYCDWNPHATNPDIYDYSMIGGGKYMIGGITAGFNATNQHQISCSALAPTRTSRLQVIS